MNPGAGARASSWSAWRPHRWLPGMYRTCLFCHASLGTNEAIENFPVGRRLAYDPAKGRLWVVCRACERWNLSALEERWEVIEESERRFRGTPLRVSTEEIGLARLSEGLELVRIGAPQRPEMAAWRYGDQFGRRRRRALLSTGLGLGVFGAVLAGGLAAGVGMGGFGYFLWSIGERIVSGNPDAVVAHLPREGAGPVRIRRKELARIRLVSLGSRGDWRLEIPRRRGGLEYSGEAALRAAGRLLPPANRYGGSRREVTDAVGFLEEAGSVDLVFAGAARLERGEPGARLGALPRPVRLALEMAAHEEVERRALEGELALLRRAWQEAEEIAGIADRLLVPDALQRTLDRLRGAAG